MKKISTASYTRSHLLLWLHGCTAAMAIAVTSLNAEVAVSFNNTTLPNTAATSLGTVTLAFTVDTSGNVTLDASTSNTAAGATAAVNAWDGPVGTISFVGAYNTSFTLTMDDEGAGGDLRLCNIAGGALGVAGTNQYRIDRGGVESIRFTANAIPVGSKLKISSMDWRNTNASPTLRAFNLSVSATNVVATPTGTWDLSSSGFLLGDTELINFGTTISSDLNKGYSFGAIRFDIVDGTGISAPTGLAATTDGSQVILDWNDALNATSYSVYRSATAGGPYGTAIATGLGTSAFTDATVTTGSTYYYVVTASDASAQSANSNESSIAVVIPAPTDLTRIQGDGSINLDWADSTSPIFASYSVYRSEISGGSYTSIATGLTTSAYTDNTVINGTTYYYVVTALDNVIIAESVNSSQVSGTPYEAISGSTLYGHLDGSLSASVTADGTTNIVSAWADQTVNAFDASTGVGTVFYSGFASSQSGLSGLDMGFTTGAAPKSTLTWFSAAQQDQWLDFSSGAGALPYGGFSVFAVVHPDTVLGGSNRDVVMGSTETEFSLRYEAGRPQVRLGNAILQGKAGAVNAGTTVVLAVNYNATSGELKLWDSKSNTTSTNTVAAADFSSASAIFLGGSSNPDQFMKGMLGEAKVYRGVLTDTELSNQQVELAFKWGGLQTPAGLTGISGSVTVVLDWGDQVADFYTVSRSETSGGPYEQVATNILTSTYSDTTVSAGTTYYYVISATEDTYGESPQSAELGILSYTTVAGSVLYTHLDATNTDSVSTTNGVVNTWQDLTANGNDAVEVANGIPGENFDTGDVLYPGTSFSASGLAGLNFGPDRNLLQLFDPAAQDDWLDFSSVGPAKPYSGFAVFIALKADSILGTAPDLARDVVLANADNVRGKFLIRYQSGRPEMYLNGVAAFQGANRIVAGDTVILAANYNSATGALEFWDSASGLAANATVPAADFSSIRSMQLGGSFNVVQRMDGMIGEIKIYRGTLTPEAFASERDEMATKWITVPTGGFSAWLTANNTTGAINEDHDADGVLNGVEYFFGGDSNTTGFTSLPGVVNTAGTLSVTWNKGSGYSGDYDTDYWIETSTTLTGTWTKETLSGDTVTDDPGFVKYTFPTPLTGKRFVRLNVTGP